MPVPPFVCFAVLLQHLMPVPPFVYSAALLQPVAPCVCFAELLEPEILLACIAAGRRAVPESLLVPAACFAALPGLPQLSALLPLVAEVAARAEQQESGPRTSTTKQLEKNMGSELPLFCASGSGSWLRNLPQKVRYLAFSSSVRVGSSISEVEACQTDQLTENTSLSLPPHLALCLGRRLGCCGWFCARLRQQRSRGVRCQQSLCREG